MALIEKAKGRRKDQTPSGYTRLFGIQDLGILISRIQATVISSGTELEKLIWDRVNQIKNLDEFVANTMYKPMENIWVARKEEIKRSKIVVSKYNPDFIAIDSTKRTCYVIEIKDGDQFDTKKANSEYTALHSFSTDISQVLPFSTQVYLCSFNAKTKDDIYNGLKRKFPITELITGKELCTKLLNIDFYDIVETRTKHQQDNLNYFVKELLSIKEIRAIIIKLLKYFND